MRVTAYIGLGSNLGDRRELLDRALQALREIPNLLVVRVSSYRETEPVGGPRGQGTYLNAAAELQTDLGPEALLRQLLQIENSLGRVRTEHHGPRTVDLDLLLYGDRIIAGPDLIVPHPRMHERTFVLEPLAEIAPSAVHPLLHQTAAWMFARLTSRELSGLRAVVTGSTSGIGLAIARELTLAGARLILHGRNANKAAAAANQLARASDMPLVVLADLTRVDEHAALVDSAWKHRDGIDIWVNNAGADTLTGEAGRWPFERKLEELWAVNVRATISLSRQVGSRMKKAGRGVILNMGWDQAEIGMESDSGQLFASTKAAVMAFSKSLALTLAPEVRVNCLAPGWVRTAWGESASGYWQDRARRETPLARWGTPEDVAAAARWLCSSAASFLTGQIIRVNGGAVR